MALPNDSFETLEAHMKKLDINIKQKVCAYCHKQESRRYEFKRCRKCRSDPNITKKYYYCSQECTGIYTKDLS